MIIIFFATTDANNGCKRLSKLENCSRHSPVCVSTRSVPVVLLHVIRCKIYNAKLSKLENCSRPSAVCVSIRSVPLALLHVIRCKIYNATDNLQPSSTTVGGPTTKWYFYCCGGEEIRLSVRQQHDHRDAE